MNIKTKADALDCVNTIQELKKKRVETTDIQRWALLNSPVWAVRETARASFLKTKEEMELYYGALVSAIKKMEGYK